MKTVVITGASDGIGAAAARTTAERGDRVIVVGRSPEKTAAVANEIGAEYFTADFARLDDVRALAASLLATAPQIDVLANNAGGIFGDRTPTVDGHEKTLQVNHLAPFLLTHLLGDTLRASNAAIINTSSVGAARYGHIDMDDLGNEKKYSPNKAYGDAKLANILFTRGLHERFHRDGVTSVAFHPGMVATGFAADTTSWLRWFYRTPLSRLFMVSATTGGDTLSWFIGGEPDVTWLSGHYYDERSLTTQMNPQVLDDSLVDALWERSAELVGISRSG
ncbi:SDR family NAD(P)-dependent oxidoreductase [Microbacterium lacus]|uniref:SDR family NAD(P)-dependent oxidoreductase n=1 Tax=Microbacterium lacus TaxID=415217 RepID=UPI0038513017